MHRPQRTVDGGLAHEISHSAHAASRSHARIASRSAACRVIRFFFARASTRAQMLSGKRTERGWVLPTSRSFLGRPRPTCTTRPSAAMRAAYGLGRSFVVLKSISGIACKEAFEGSGGLRACAFFVTAAFVLRREARADEADFVLALVVMIYLDVDRHEDSGGFHQGRHGK